MMTATAATIRVVEATWFAALTALVGVRAALVLAFWATAKLRTTVAAAIVATTASATATLVAAAISTAVAAFVTTTVAALAFVLALGRSGRSLCSRVAAEESFQPAEEAGFLGFDGGRRWLRFEGALLTALFAELFFTLAGLLATGFAGAKLVARFLRLFATGGTIIRACGTVGIARGLTVFVPLRAEVRAAFAARIGAGARLFRFAADFPALGMAGVFFGRKDF